MEINRMEEASWHCGECQCREQHEGSQYHQLNQKDLKQLPTCVKLIAGVGFVLCALHLFFAAVVIGYVRSGQVDGHQSTVTHFQQLQQQHRSPSALLTAPRSYNNTRKFLEWETEMGNAHLHGFDYDDGDLIVSTDGSYRIYLQITYSSDGESICINNDIPVVLSQAVVLHANNYPTDKILISSVDSVECEVKTWQKSISTTAVFFLRAQDRLRVSVLQPKCIVPDENKVYFGVDLR